jgi:hypothetical protein
MIDPRETDNGRNETALFAALCDRLVPGDGRRWPSASAAGLDAVALLAELDEGAKRVATALIDVLAVQGEAALDAELKPRGRDADEPFRRLLRALYRRYYTLPAVQVVVAALADEGPREVSPYFDAALLDRVVARQAGQRRL